MRAEARPPGHVKNAAGRLLSDAAAYAADARRLMIAAIVCAEEATANIEDVAELMAEANIETFDSSALLADVSTFAEDLQRVADAFGHREVWRISRGRVSA